MMFIAKLIATCFGIGYIQKGAGTVAALFCCVLWWLLRIDSYSLWVQFAIILLVFVAGMLVSNLLEKEWAHDSNRVVIDEVLGMCTSLVLVPFSLWYFGAAFILFRFFDILKPLGIRRMEAYPAGLGVMMDDLLAGIYTCVILQLIIKSHLF